MMGRWVVSRRPSRTGGQVRRSRRRPRCRAGEGRSHRPLQRLDRSCARPECAATSAAEFDQSSSPEPMRLARAACRRACSPSYRAGGLASPQDLARHSRLTPRPTPRPTKVTWVLRRPLLVWLVVAAVVTGFWLWRHA
jgi:hypothetical protein